MDDGVVSQNHSALFESLDNAFVGVFDILARKIWNFGFELAFLVQRINQSNSVRFANAEVIFAKRGRVMNDASSFFGANVFVRENPKCVRGLFEIWKERQIL